MFNVSSESHEIKRVGVDDGFVWPCWEPYVELLIHFCVLPSELREDSQHSLGLSDRFFVSGMLMLVVRERLSKSSSDKSHPVAHSFAG